LIPFSLSRGATRKNVTLVCDALKLEINVSLLTRFALCPGTKVFPKRWVDLGGVGISWRQGESSQQGHIHFKLQRVG